MSAEDSETEWPHRASNHTSGHVGRDVGHHGSHQPGRDEEPFLNCRVIEHETDFATLASDWQRLADADDDTSVFNGWAWNHAWWSHYGNLGNLHVLVVSSGDVVRGIAPFYRTSSRLLRVVKLPTLRFLGSGGDTSPDDLDLVAEPQWKEQVADVVVQHLFDASGCTRFDLTDLPADSVFFSALQEAAVARGHVTPRVVHATRAVDQLPGTVADWRSALSRNARKQLKRRRNRLDDIAKVHFSRCTTPDAVNEAHAALVRLHHARRESLGDTGGFRSDAYVAFHLAVMQALLDRDELRLYVLSFDDAIVAVEYAFEVHDTLAFFQSGFSPEHAVMAPAHLLMHHMVEQAIESGTQRIDLLKGDYEYKRGFAAGTRTTLSVDLCTRNALAHVVGIARRLKGAMKASP